MPANGPDPMLEAAQQYAEAGLKIFPCHSIIELPDGKYCSCGKPATGEPNDKAWCRQAGKHPRCKHGLNDATNNSAKIRAWWRQWPGSYIGLATGEANGVYVLDDDPRHGRGLAELEEKIGKLAPTLTALTGGGGRHLYYLLPAEGEWRNKRAVVDGLDCRGTGGYVLLPPSGHLTGGEYRWQGLPIGRGQVEPMPANLREYFAAQEKKVPPAVPDGPVPEVSDRLLKAVMDRVVYDARHATEGTRNHMLYRAAHTLAGFIAHQKISAIEIREILTPIGEDLLDQGVTQTRKSIESGIRSGEKRPMPITPLKRGGPDRSDAEAPPPRGTQTSTMEDFIGGAPLSQEALDDAHLDAEEGEGKRGPSLDTLAASFAAEHLAQLMYTETGQWYEYAGSHWEPVSTDPVEQITADWLRETRRNWKKNRMAGAAPGSPRTKTIKEIMRLASTGAGRLGTVRVRELNPNPYWIPCANGIYDRQTRQLLPHDPKHRITYVLPFNFDPAATCPRFDQFLREVLITQDGEPCLEWIDLMQMWFGYLLTGDMSAHLSFVLLGGGRNGKGVLTNIMERLLGPQQCTAVSIEQLGVDYHRAALIGKRLGLINEPDRRAMLKNGNIVKAIVGGDLIEGRNPYEKPVRFHPETRFVISTNSLPETRDLSKGYFARLLIFEFRRTFTNPDTGLLDTLTLELPGILNFALLGLEMYEANGRRFPDSPESAALMGEYIRSENYVAQFCEEECLKEGRCLSNDWWSGFDRWQKDTRVTPPLSRNQAGRDLTALGFKLNKEKDKREGINIRPDSHYAPQPKGGGQRTFDDMPPHPVED